MNVSAAFPHENAGWPVMMVNPDGVILRTNRAGVEVFGASAYEGRNASGFWTEGGPTIAEVLAGAQPVLELELSIQPTGRAKFLVSVLPLVNGEVKNYLLQFFKLQPPAPGAQPSPEPVSAAATGAIEANMAHKQKLDCAMQLARSVSLDFNNALTSIIGYVSLLLSRAEQDHPWRNSLVEIEKSAERAAEIANDLASFSRQERELPGRKAGNLNEVLRQTIDAFRMPENQMITFETDFEPRLFSAKFDEAKLQQAFVKILENAVQSIAGKGTVTVRSRNFEAERGIQEKTSRLSPGTYIRVEVVDTGGGISQETLPRIFEPFYTTKGAAHRGLGLTWVYGIVTNHGGGVSVTSKPEGGTTVVVYLPASKGVIRGNVGSPDEMCGVETVLLVDDEDLLLNMGQMVLSSFGYRALIANTGQQALNILSSETVDLVITDLVMPGMSGRELIDRIRLLTPGAKIICSSGYVRPANQSEESYLQKPFTAQELLRKVRQSLSSEQGS